MTQEQIQKMQDAMDYLIAAHDILQTVNSSDCDHFANKVKEIVSCDNNEGGLMSLIEKMQ